MLKSMASACLCRLVQEDRLRDAPPLFKTLRGQRRSVVGRAGQNQSSRMEEPDGSCCKAWTDACMFAFGMSTRERKRLKASMSTTAGQIIPTRCRQYSEAFLYRTLESGTTAEKVRWTDFRIWTVRRNYRRLLQKKFQSVCRASSHQAFWGVHNSRLCGSIKPEPRKNPPTRILRVTTI
jgi:hypothetical protein